MSNWVNWKDDFDKSEKPKKTASIITTKDLDSKKFEEIKNSTPQAVSEIIIMSKSWSNSDIGGLIKEHTINYPHSPEEGKLIIYADPTDFRQIQELESNHPWLLIEAIKRIELKVNEGTWLTELSIKIWDLDRWRFSAYKNTEYNFLMLYFDAWFVTTTIWVRHANESFSTILNFNIEITCHIDADNSTITYRVNCTCNQNWKSLNVYKNRLKNSNHDYLHYYNRLMNSMSKEETFNTFIEMLEYWFFNDDFNEMLWINK